MSYSNGTTDDEETDDTVTGAVEKELHETQTKVTELSNSARKLEDRVDDLEEEEREIFDHIFDLISTNLQEQNRLSEQLDETTSHLDQLSSGIETNSQQITSVRNNQSEIREVQIQNQERFSELVNGLTTNLFLPIAKGLALFSGLATIVFLLDRSIAALPSAIVLILFLTGIKLANNTDDNVS